jgi:hypothetical protein
MRQHQKNGTKKAEEVKNRFFLRVKGIRLARKSGVLITKRNKKDCKTSLLVKEGS